MARSTKPKGEAAKLQRGFGLLAALGVLLVIGGVSGSCTPPSRP